MIDPDRIKAAIAAAANAGAVALDFGCRVDHDDLMVLASMFDGQLDECDFMTRQPDGEFTYCCIEALWLTRSSGVRIGGQRSYPLTNEQFLERQRNGVRCHPYATRKLDESEYMPINGKVPDGSR